MVIFDTNVLISAALISGSRGDAWFRGTLLRRVPLVFSAATFAELEEVLMRATFDRYIPRRSREAILSVWRDAAFFVPSTVIREPVADCSDVSYNTFLELALATEAIVIVTGDPDLLVLDPWRGIRIVGLREFDSVFPLSDDRVED